MAPLRIKHAILFLKILDSNRQLGRNHDLCVCSGIPFVFPQFGDWMYGPNGPPNNGFARISRWQLEKVCTGLPTKDETVKTT